MNQVDDSINHRRAQNFMDKHKEFPGAFRQQKKEKKSV